ncbi:efflux RND transporter periplasmic adaptor subunit [Rudaea sp.]|uniref:efflux RND transporter periplasmic adaptor subunit n=1 Tax=Rudaea sp. TaxID=2136325 RepID=UPI002ECFAE44
MKSETIHSTGRRSRAVVSVLGLLLAGCSSGGNVNPPASAAPGNLKLTAAQMQHVHLYTVAEAKFHKAVQTSGTVDFDEDHATGVLAPISGPVSKLLVAPGDRVKKGQALATVDSPDFAAAVGAYRKAEAAARNARRVADVDKDLLAHKGVSEREAAQAQSDAVGAESDRDAARQALASLGVDAPSIAAIASGRDIAFPGGTIRAPLAGIVVERLITPGQLLQVGTTACFTLADVSRVWVLAQVFGADIGQVGVGDGAQIQVGDTTLQGKVTNVADEVDATTRAVVARVSVDNPHGALKKQMYVPVSLVSRNETNGLMAPASAILRDDENLPFVYVAQADGSFARAHVTPGYRDGDNYQIDTGLKAGDQIVADGGLFLQFMQSQ